MAYGCWFYVEARCWDGQITFERYEELPFVPSNGMAIVWDDENCDLETVRFVEYSVNDDAFWCWCNATSWVEERNPADRLYSVLSAKKSYVEKGWAVFSETQLTKDDKSDLDEQRPDWRKFKQGKSRGTFRDVYLPSTRPPKGEQQE